MNDKPLYGMTIIDFSHRLPGPLCAKILGDYGARVIKIEDKKFRDPFLNGLFSKIDDSFVSWYKNLNEQKEVLQFDFENSLDQKKMYELVIASDAVIMGIPHKTRKKLGLEKHNLDLKKPFVCLELLASANEKKSMHDLNALALTGLLSLFVARKNEKTLAPPFLPIAGINFGHKAATDLLAGYIKASKANQTEFVQTFMDEATRDILGLFWSEEDRRAKRTQFLHNGLYPCYCIYQTKDLQYVALAAVEEKFWLRFCDVFNLDKGLDRFETKQSETFLAVSTLFSAYTMAEIEQMMASEDLCLSPIYTT